MGEVRSGGIPRQYSLRTLLYATTGAGVVCGIATTNVILFLVLFAAVAVVVSASLGMELAENCIILATLSTLLISFAVLCFGAVHGMLSLWTW